MHTTIEEQAERTNSSARWGRGIGYVTILTVLLFASVIVNCLLARKVSKLRTVISAMQSEGRLQPGAALPALQGFSIDGKPQSLNYADVRVPTVLYVFTPQCGWCAKNIENFRALIQSSGPRYRIIGVSLTRQDLKEYLQKENLQLPIYTDVEESSRKTYKLGGTPATVVMSPDSKVLKSWSGAYVDGMRQEIEAYLSVSLPGCCSGNVQQ